MTKAMLEWYSVWAMAEFHSYKPLTVV